MGRELEIKILANAAQAKRELGQFGDDVKGTLDRGKSHFTGFASVAGGALAAIGGAAAISGLASFVSDSVQAAQEAASAQNRLTDAYAKFPAVGNVTIDTLRDLNSELGKKTRFDDDATASGQAVLAQFKLTGTQIQELTPLLQDYAAKTGKDLPDAAQDLGKAMLGQGRALKAIGIDFVDTGSAAGNFDSLMSALRRQVGGFAQSEGKTAAGQAAILANQFGEVQEQIGEALMPGLMELSSFMLSNVVPALSNTVTWLTENWSWISTTGAAITGLVGVYALYRGGLAAYATVTGIVTAAQTAWTAASYGGVAASYANATATGAQALAARGATAAQVLLSGSLATVALRVGIAGGALGALIAVIGAVTAKQAEMTAGAQELRETLDEQTGAVSANTRATVAKKLADGDAYAVAKQAGISQKQLVDALLEGGDALDTVNTKLRDYQNNGQMFNASVGFARNQIRELGVQLDDARQDFGDVAAATDSTKASTNDAADAYAGAADEVEGLKTGIEQLIEQIDEANGKNSDAISANAAWQGALAGLNDELEKQQKAYVDANGSLDGFVQSLDTTTLDQNTAAGSANAAMLADVAGKARDSAAAQFEVDKATMSVKDATEKYSGTLAAQRQAFIDSAVQAGYNRDEVSLLADKIFSLPTERQTKMLVETSQAEQRIQDLKASLASFRDSNYGVNVAAYVRSVGGMATGGQVRGPGTGTSDSVLSWLSNGEFVVKESAASKNMGLLSWINGGGVVPAFAAGGLAGGSGVSLSAIQPLVQVEAMPRRAVISEARTGGGGDGPLRLDREDLDYMADRIGQTVYPLIMAGAQRTVRTALRG